MTSRLVRDINPSGSSSPDELIFIEGSLFFLADSGQGASNANNQPINEDAASDEDEDSSSDSSQGDTDTNGDEESASNGEQASGAGPSTTGIGLWKSDGSEGGTTLIRAFDSASNLVEANGLLYFVAKTGEGYEIWSSDGTPAGTQRANTLYPGADNFAPYNLFAIDDVLFFSASGPSDSSNGYELWRWEGDGVGTKLFKNLFPDRYITQQSIEFNEETGQQELKIETAQFNTSDPEYSTDSFPQNFTSVGNGNFFFTAYSTNRVPATVDGFADEIQLGGIELWYSDGTENGTRPIRINEQSYEIYNPTAGTASPPSIYDEVYTASGSSFPRELTAFNDTLFFTANDGIHGYELRSVDGDGEDEKLISDINSSGSSTPKELTVVGNKIYFTADDGSGRFLYSYNPSKEQLIKIEQNGTQPRNLTEIDGSLYYSAYSSDGREPWFINKNGIPSQLQDINPGPASSNPSEFQLITGKAKGKVNKTLYFTANNGAKGIELWSKSLNQSGEKARLNSDIFSGPSSSDPRKLINAEEDLFFTADNGKSGRELWTLGPAIKGPNGGYGAGSSSIKVDENKTFVYTFSAKTEKEGSGEWQINGGSDYELFSIASNTGKLTFIDAPDFEKPKDTERDNNYEVAIRVTDQESGLSSDQYVTVKVQNVSEAGPDDGTVGEDPDAEDPEENPNEGDPNNNTPEQPGIESKLVKNIREGGFSSNPTHLHDHLGVLYYSANDGINGAEPWVSNFGTKQSTTLFKDIFVGPQSSSPSSFSSYNNTLLFSANGGEFGQELWISNGNAKQTKLAADINPGTKSSSPSDFLIQGDTAYFSANDGRSGHELWNYSLKNNKAKLVRNINTNTGTGSNPSELTSLNGEFVFAAKGNAYGRELWISDGTLAGTTLLKDINPGGLDSSPEDLSTLNGDIYFTGNTYFNGRQILKLNGNNLSVSELANSSSEYTASEPDDLHSSNDQLFYSALTGTQPAQTDTPSIGGSSTSDPGGFMKAADGISADAVRYINDYNRRISQYRESNDISDIQAGAGGAGFSANLLLESENDSSLAQDWNQYFQPLTNDAPLQIPADTPTEAASRNSGSSTGGSNLTPTEEGNTISLGRELWISNGKNDGNKLLLDINPGPASSNPTSFSTVGTKTYFSADDGISGEELWVSDGTEDGTYRLTDINEGSKDSSPRSITESGGAIYFSAKSDQYGRELWRIGEPEKSSLNFSFSTDIIQEGEESTSQNAIKANNKNGSSTQTTEIVQALAGQDELINNQNQTNDPSSNNIALTRILQSKSGKGRLRGKKNTTDEFVFSSKKQFGYKKADRIIRFSPEEGDHLKLDSDAFPDIKKIRFRASKSLRHFNKQQKKKSTIIYFEPTGELYFDQNGKQPGFGEAKESGLFAILKGAPEITSQDLSLL